MAEEDRTFELPTEFSDPYKRTQLFIKDGRAFYGLWNEPPVVLDGDEQQVVVSMGLEGQLDLFAQTFLGDRKLWRAIAQVNRIDFPLEEVKAGDVIIIPKLQNVNAAYRDTQNRSTNS